MEVLIGLVLMTVLTSTMMGLQKLENSAFKRKIHHHDQ